MSHLPGTRQARLTTRATEARADRGYISGAAIRVPVITSRNPESYMCEAHGNRQLVLQTCAELLPAFTILLENSGSITLDLRRLIERQGEVWPPRISGFEDFIISDVLDISAVLFRAIKPASDFALVSYSVLSYLSPGYRTEFLDSPVLAAALFQLLGERELESFEPAVPKVFAALSLYDSERGLNLTFAAAKAYRSLVIALIAASGSPGDFRAAQTTAKYLAQYLEILQPYSRAPKTEVGAEGTDEAEFDDEIDEFDE